MKYFLAVFLLTSTLGCGNQPDVVKVQVETKIQGFDFPHILFIRGHRWVVILDETNYMDNHHIFGETNCKDEEILVKSGLTVANQRDTLFHEILHAGTCTESKDGDVNNLYWNSSTPEKHEGIYRLSQYLTELFYENPELVKYLAGQ